MHRFRAAWMAGCLVVGGIGSASAFPVSEMAQPSATELVANFEGTIPTEDKPLTGEKRLAKMRRDGKLPDTFVRGRCTYNLAGDPAAAYYVKECR